MALNWFFGCLFEERTLLIYKCMDGFATLLPYMTVLCRLRKYGCCMLKMAGWTNLQVFSNSSPKVSPQATSQTLKQQESTNYQILNMASSEALPHTPFLLRVFYKINAYPSYVCLYLLSIRYLYHELLTKTYTGLACLMIQTRSLNHQLPWHKFQTK